MPWWQPVKLHRWELLANVNSSCDKVPVSCAGRYAPRTGRSLACLTLVRMLSLSPLSAVFGADMSKNCGSFRFGNNLWLSPCRRLLSRCIRVCGRLRLAELGTLRRQLRFPLLAGVCHGCSRSPSLLKLFSHKREKWSRKKFHKWENKAQKKPAEAGNFYLFF